MKKIVSLGFDEARAEAREEEKFATVKRMLKRGKRGRQGTLRLKIKV